VRRVRPVQRLTANIVSVDVFFLLVAGADYAAFVTWASLMVRTIKGDEVKESLARSMLP
jgi:hypothetical protein